MSRTRTRAEEAAQAGTDLTTAVDALKIRVADKLDALAAKLTTAEYQITSVQTCMAAFSMSDMCGATPVTNDTLPGACRGLDDSFKRELTSNAQLFCRSQTVNGALQSDLASQTDQVAKLTADLAEARLKCDQLSNQTSSDATLCAADRQALQSLTETVQNKIAMIEALGV